MKLPIPSRYPKTIEIRDETYQIKIVKTVPKMPRDTFGACDSSKRVIWLRQKQSKRGMFRTLIHEILHAVEAEYNLNLKHKRINVLEIALEALLTDNF